LARSIASAKRELMVNGPAYWPLRLLPLFAALIALVGVVLPGRPHVPIIAGILFASALALELGGWARATRAYGKPLATAAFVGAAVGGVLLLAFMPLFDTTVDSIAQR
jgi:hypothetical protein